MQLAEALGSVPPNQGESRPMNVSRLTLGLAACVAFASCAGDAPRQRTAEPAGPVLRIAKEGSTLGRIDLFHYHPTAGRMERLAHCPEGCAQTSATLPAIDAELEAIDFSRMSFIYLGYYSKQEYQIYG